MIRLDITVEDITTIMANGYTHLRVYSDTSQTGTFATLEGTVTLVAGTNAYSFVDVDGTSSLWYKVAYYGSGPGESEKSEAQRGGTVDAYCTPPEIREQIDKSDTADDATLWDLAVMASRAIDNYCGWEPQAFNKDSTADDETRIYLGAGFALLLCAPDGILDVTTVTEDTTALESDDFRLWPENAAARGRPYLGLRRLPHGSYWPESTDISVEGQFGYSYTIPSPIKQAAVVVAARLWKRGQQGFGDASASIDLGQMFYAKQLDPEVKLWLDAYKRQPL